jgi:hypothetical protein
MSLREINKAIIQKYSQSTLSKFDIIGSYFVNLYYNEFYLKAKHLKNQGTYNNITEAYKNLLSSYVEFSKQQDFFKQIVKGIHTYCISTTRYTTMSHKECIDFMVSEFVPNNLWSSLRENQKNKLFHESLISCIAEFTEKIILNHLYIIIDNHDKDENIIILQDLFLTIILLEKDKIFSKFIKPNKSNIDLFKNKIQQIIDDKNKLSDENNTLNKKLSILEELNKKNSNIIIELQKNNKNLNSILLKKQKEIEQLSKKEQLLNQKILEYINALQIVNKKSINPIQKIINKNNLEENKLEENNLEENKLEENNLEENNLEENHLEENNLEENHLEETYSIKSNSTDNDFEKDWGSTNNSIIRELVYDKTNDNDYY